jgi:hypothetical protein
MFFDICHPAIIKKSDIRCLILENKGKNGGKAGDGLLARAMLALWGRWL